MKKIIATMFLMVGMAITSQSQNKADFIIGEWINEKKDAKFQISKLNGLYFGKIIWGTGEQKKDTKNPDANLRNKEVIGLTILKNFAFDGDDTWEKGTIYDPREGKTYSCKITQKGKNQINVRGFLGIAMFGRTEVWTRLN